MAPDTTESTQRLVESGLMTVQEAAKFLGLSRSKVYGLMEAGRLRYTKIDRARRVPRQAVIDLAHASLQGGA